MITLNHIAYSVAETLGRPNDYFLREKIKLTAVGLRATLLRRDLAVNILSKQFLQSLGCVPLVCIDAGNCCGLSTGTQILRTSLQIPTPIRTKDDSTFYFVGIADRSLSFTETSIDSYYIESHDRFTKHFPKYFWLDGYIYVLNPPEENIKYINVTSIFADPRDVAKFNNCAGVDCYTDDSNFPLDMDMWYQMEAMLIQQYRNESNTHTEEVKVNND